MKFDGSAAARAFLGVTVALGAASDNSNGHPAAATAFSFPPQQSLTRRSYRLSTAQDEQRTIVCRRRRRRTTATPTLLLASSAEEEEGTESGDGGSSTKDVRKKAAIIDAVVEESTTAAATDSDDGEENVARRRKRDVFNQALRDLASLSLVDYKWRSALFKKNEADRMEEELLARMMGEDASYARPMDADDSRRGPLGNAEKSAVQWLKSVIEEEGRRAKRIAESDGELVRPKDLSTTDDAGPLSELERRAVAFLSNVSDSEVERVRSGTVRPMDMDYSSRGPLGTAEARAVLALERIVDSEKSRMDQSRLRGGENVRPIDVPGPLGEFERAVGDIVRSEQQRVKDRDINEGKIVRPKDASIRSTLGEVERKASEDWELLRQEEKDRYSSFQRFLSERRPMEWDKDSPLGVTEAFTVGLLRGPQLIAKVANRVKELMTSEELDGKDKDILENGLPSTESNLAASEKKDGVDTDSSDGDGSLDKEEEAKP